MTAAVAFQPIPLRQRTGTSSRRRSPKRNDFAPDDVDKLSDLQVVHHFAEHFWGSTTEMPCPHCGTIDTHYWRRKEMRWKCKSCDKTFSVTSATVLADHKMPLRKILKALCVWMNAASGVPAAKLQGDWRVAYGSIFTLLHKAREAMSRGFNTGIVSGTHEMDGLDLLGRNHELKRGKPQVVKNTGKKEIPAHLLKPQGVEMGPPKPPKHDKKAKQPEDRRIMLSLCQRGVSKGLGSIATFVGITRTETTAAVTKHAHTHASAESHMMSDEDPAYAAFARHYARHDTVNHSETFSKPGGISNNQAESFNMRVKRAITGIYLGLSNKYLHEYCCEQAWRKDTVEMKASSRIGHLLSVLGRVGPSRYWRGYTHGFHRKHEILVDGTLPAKAHGRRKGWKSPPPR
jgi:transposase-like protein